MKLPQHSSGSPGNDGVLTGSTRLIDMNAQELVNLIERILDEREIKNKTWTYWGNCSPPSLHNLLAEQLK